MIKDYKIIKELGYGFYGTVFLVEKKGKKYALKIEHILPSHLKKDLSSPTWREIDFSKNLANKNPDQFMQLLEYDFIDKCKLVQKYPSDVVPKNMYFNLKNLKESPYCSIKIYNYIDYTINSFPFQSLKEYYSILIQLVYAVYLMHKNGYVHLDLHSGNIGIIKTDKKYLKIFGKKVPTFGNLLQIIDFGRVLHKKYKMNKKEKNLYKLALKKEVLWVIINNAYNVGAFHWPKNANYEEQLEKFKKTIEYKSLGKITKDDSERFGLYQLIYQEKFQRELLGDKFEKFVPIQLYIPINDIIFVVKYQNNLKKIINYFLMLIHYMG